MQNPPPPKKTLKMMSIRNNCGNKHKIQTIIRIGEDTDKLKPSYIAYSNVKRYGHSGLQFVSFLKN